MQSLTKTFRATARLLVLLICVSPGTASITAAQAPGTFARTGDMTTPRSFHSATLLSNGQVLIVGGASSGVLASAEVYDPSDGTFRAVGGMASARRLHSATLLPDNRVLIVGGYGEDRSALTSAEIFDPATGAFSATGSLAVARGFHTAILLSTGEVLIIGGYGTRAYPNVAPAELYNPSSGVFRTAGASVGRGGCDFCAPSVLLSEGTVLFPWENPAQLYDPLSDSFSPSGSMSIELSGAALLTNGRVLFAGGAPIARVADAELYNPVTRTFARTGDMTSRRVWHTLTALPNGMALAAGGETDSCAGNGCTFAGSVASAELYDPTAGRFSPTGNMAVARETHTATLLGDGRVLMAGGVSYGGIGIFGGSLASVELYTPGVLVPTPALVALSGDGHGQGAIFHAGTSHVASAEDPSSTDADVDIYCRGLTEESVIVPRVVIGGRIAAVSSVTKAPDVAGVHVLRLRVPRGITPGTAVPVRLIHMDRPSNVVTMGVR